MDGLYAWATWRLVAAWARAADIGSAGQTRQHLQWQDLLRTARSMQPSVLLLKASSVHELG
ncbi:hypothetical protein EYC54_16980 [Xanthomonas oryzae]|nr:hypothetical protein [Xanthomonas oryzae]QBG90242.1 hypothetical protein EYC54_16980 [Xanthomonas oryzae]UNE64785.1 hypothetical protein MML47_17060 [Xanthomonas oryzae]